MVNQNITKTPVVARTLVLAFLLIPFLTPCFAQEDTEFPKFTLGGVFDFRFARTDDTLSWLDRGLGKTRYGALDGRKAELFRLSQVSLSGGVAFSDIFSARLQLNIDADPDRAKQRSAVDVIEAFVSYRPVLSPSVRLRLRGGIFFPPVSLENTGPAWTSPYTITTSAINSWIGEEVRPTGGEMSLLLSRNAHEWVFTGAAFGNNDPTGTLLAWRGWALHDRQTGFRDRLPLPPIPAIGEGGLFPRQPDFVHPFTEVDGRLGYYASAGWTNRFFELRAMHYDNRGKESVFDGEQYAWNTRFDHAGIHLNLPANFEVIGQWMDGRTRMGTADQVDADFYSEFLLVSWSHEASRISVRYDRFRVEDRNFDIESDNNESGHVWTAAHIYKIAEKYRLEFELLRVESVRPARAGMLLPVHATETLLQAGFRVIF